MNSSKFSFEGHGDTPIEAIEYVVELYLDNRKINQLFGADKNYFVVIDDKKFIVKTERIGYEMYAILEDGGDIGTDVYDVAFTRVW